MGLLDSVVGMVTGQSDPMGQGGGNQAALIAAVVSMLNANGSGGGLNDLIARFEQGGLGSVIGSWVSTGHNLPISAEQLQSVLGSGQLGQIAEQLGLTHGEAAAQLSQVLPQVVDHLTPNGQVPVSGDAGSMGDIGSLIGSLLRR
ncbi:YidB family protein [Rhizobacter sp. P5_C2]